MKKKRRRKEEIRYDNMIKELKDIQRFQKTFGRYGGLVFMFKMDFLKKLSDKQLDDIRNELWFPEEGLHKEQI